MDGPLIPIENGAQRAAFSVQVAFAVITPTCVGLRLLARRKKGVALQWDDYLIIIALVLDLGLIACDMIETLYCGVGMHAMDVVLKYGPNRLIVFLKVLIPIQILWASSLTATKFSILLFYCRVFSVPLVRRVAKFAVVIICMWCASVILSAFLLCRPFAFNWDQTIPNGHCGNQVLSYIMTGVVNILTDLLVLGLPLPVIWNLQMRTANRLGLIALFATGFFVCVVSIVRLKALLTLDYTDITHSVTLALIWSMIEPSVAIILSCVPIMRSLVPKVFRSLTGSSNKRSGGETPYSKSQSKSRELDEHPLRPMRKKNIYADLETTVVGEGEDDRSTYSGGKQEYAMSGMHGGGVKGAWGKDDGKDIVVTREWEIRNSGV